MRIAYDDLKELVPPTADHRKLQIWDRLWDEQKTKSKRMKLLEAESLPKRVRIAQDAVAAAGPSKATNVSGAGVIMRTVYNSMCPHCALVEGPRIGAGAFGEVKKYTVRGNSFFPEHTTYCGKHFKGGSFQKFESFQTQQGI